MTIAKDAYAHYEPAGKEVGFLPLIEGMRVLEIGFGTGELLRALRERGNKVYGLDVGRDIVNKAKAAGLDNVFLLDVSEEDLPFEDDFFDAIYCYEVMEHLTNPHRLFSEIRRTLKKGHQLYFSVPCPEVDMGYGHGRHPFVYPGLCEKANLERFFMQMYFRVDGLVEPGGRLVGRSYTLTNMKDPGKPDIVEVVTAPYNLVQLYRDVLSPDRLEKEVRRETQAYMPMMEECGREGHWRDLAELVRYLMRQFPEHAAVHLDVARALLSCGQPALGMDLLRQILGHEELPEGMLDEARRLLESAERSEAG